MDEILSIEAHRRADAAAETQGISTLSLMERAGAAIAVQVHKNAASGPVAVLAGPGNNGGDGFAAATQLRNNGRDVRIWLSGEFGALKGDAARAAAAWNGPVSPLSACEFPESGVAVDALFGAGLARPLDGHAARLAESSLRSKIPVVAADVPSGLHGDRAAALGPVFRADATVTFFRKKPAHILEPGRSLCGEIVVADIGIPDSVLPALDVRTWENTPGLWRPRFPRPGAATHKHNRGRLAVLCGPALATGAARLAVAGGRRAGAGFTTLVGEEDALHVAAAHETGAVLHAARRGHETAQAIREFGAHAAVLGPASGADVATLDCVLDLLRAPEGKEGPALVLDADALTVFGGLSDVLFSAMRGDVVLTPHDGEFSRLFPDLGAAAFGEAGGSKLDRVRAAAARAGCVVLLKGADTVIAAPPDRAGHGRAAVNTQTSPYLASAGTGDVLAGVIGGLLAQGMPAFEAACAGVWLHGRAGRALGAGLIAEDLPGALPDILRDL